MRLNRGMKRRAAAIALVASLAAMAAGCAGNQKGTESQTNRSQTEDGQTAGTSGEKADSEQLPALKVSVHPAYITLPVAYAYYHDMDQEYGFDMDLQVYASGAPQNEALGAGLWDVGVIGGAFAFSVNTYDASVIGDFIDGRDGNAIFVRKDSDIAQAKGSNPTYPDILGSADTVRGKTLITNVGTTGHIQAIKWLEALGLTESDVNIIQMDYAQGYQAFITGEGDILATIGPYSTKAEIAQKDEWKIAAGFLALDIPQYETVVASKDAMGSKREQLVNFLRMIYAANDILAQDMDLQVETYMRWMKENGKEVDEAEARMECKQKPVLTSDQALTITEDGSFGEYEKMVWEINIESGTLPADSISKLQTNVIPDLMKEALK